MCLSGIDVTSKAFLLEEIFSFKTELDANFSLGLVIMLWVTNNGKMLSPKVIACDLSEDPRTIERALVVILETISVGSVGRNSHFENDGLTTKTLASVVDSLLEGRMSVFAKVCPRSALSKILFSPEVEIFRTPLEENGVTLWSWSEETGIICSVTEK